MAYRFKRKRDAQKVAEQILLFLAAGYTLQAAYLPRHTKRVIREIPKALKNIEHRFLQRELQRLYKRKLVDMVERKGENLEIILTAEGKRRARRLGVTQLQIKVPPRWDGKWWMVFYDIPEIRRRGRNQLRQHLHRLGFRELQQSVWITPYPCKNVVAYLAEAYDLEDHLFYGEFRPEQSDEALRKRFSLEQ